MNRRAFLRGAAVTGAGSLLAQALGARRAKAPFRLLYGNDTTNLETCISPWRGKDEPFRVEHLRASIDEARGADAQLLQPGLMAVPLWKSRIHPPAEHFAWWRQMFPHSPVSSLGLYMEQGGDLVREFVAHCRVRGVAALLSVRLNDYHGLEFIDATPGSRLPAFASLAVDRVRRGHPEWRVGGPESETDLFAKRDRMVLNWALPAVRERMGALIGELCEHYDLDGIELDFLRHFRLFRLEEAPEALRKKVVSDFAGEVRATLDRTARPGRPRRLCVRIPAVLELHPPLGLDVAELERRGVDMFNLSMNYYTIQQGLDLEAIRALAPASAVYQELTHVTVVGADPGRKGDSNFYRRATAEQLLTTARLAHARGLDGVSLFNFAYYREYGPKVRGPFGEPPFHLLPQLASPWVGPGSGDPSIAAQNINPMEGACYFQGPVWRSVYRNTVLLPKKLKPREVFRWTVRIMPRPAGAPPGKFRLQSEENIGEHSFLARLDGQGLRAADSRALFPEPYPQLLGTPERLRAWEVPAAFVRGPWTHLELEWQGDAPVTLVFLELMLP